MLTEAASVLGRDGSTLRLQTSRHATCSGCSLKAGCGQYLLVSAGRDSRQDQELTVNDLAGGDEVAGCRAGDQVRIELSGGNLVMLAMCFYMLPLVLLLIATALGAWLGAGEGLLVLSGLAGLAAGCWMARWLLATQTGRRRFSLRVRRLEQVGASAGVAP